MDKLKLHSKDLTAENIEKLEKLAALFPHCVTETKAEDGSIKHAIDFDLLRQELSADLVEGPQERYRLDWPGKRKALTIANAPIAKTLRPCPEESVDFDSTKNLYIEGDNLEALKLLQETYLNKVKMIYIDPPYNTGNDFLYKDDFRATRSEYFRRSNQVDESGNRLVANLDTNGAFHSDWLSMIYPRLKIARSLLSDNGVIFISIDDGEVANLRKLADETFGEANFVAQIIWKKRNTPPNDQVIGTQHDYILVYSRTTGKGLGLRKRTEDQIARYKNPDNHSKGPWASGDLTANIKGGRYTPTCDFPIINPRSGKEFLPGTQGRGNWRFNKERIERLLKNDEIYFGKDDSSRPKLKRFLCDVKSGTTWTTLWDFAPLNTSGSEEMREIFEVTNFFENPKPTDLIKLILEAGSDRDGIVLDFFSGSASTAHAVMKLNSEDGGSRRHILVQLPEVCSEGSEPHNRGYKTIAEIGKERIRRAGAKIRAGLEAQLKGELPETDKHQEITAKLANLDTGFRVLKVDSSNMADVYYRPDEVTQGNLHGQVENIKPERTPEDLLFQVLLDWGVDLALPIEQEDIAGKTAFFVDGNALAACFDTGLDEGFVKELAKRKPLRAVFRDASFAKDATKINIEQIFKALSPITELKAI